MAKLGRKITGGKYHARRKRKKYEIPGIPRVVKLREKKFKLIGGLGGKKKNVLLSDNMVNIMINGKAKKVKILNVLETPSNKFLARQNILVKGAIIETEAGRARITNRPSQEGAINAVITESK